MSGRISSTVDRVAPRVDCLSVNVIYCRTVSKNAAFASGSVLRVLTASEETLFSGNNMDSNLAPVLLIKNDLTHTVGSGVSLPGCQQAERIK